VNFRINLPALFLRAMRRHANHAVFGSRRGDTWTWMSSQDAVLAVRETAAGLVSAGLKPGERVALLSENRPEWLLTDLGVQFAAGADVPVYPTLPPEQTAFLLRDSGARFAVVSTRDQAAKLAKVRGDMPALEKVFCIDGPAEGVIALDRLRADGRASLASNPERLEERLAGLGPDSLATIIYTSGTTGTPKGVMLTHGNFCHNVAASLELFAFDEGDTALSFLPLSHVLERMVSYAYIDAGIKVAFIKGPQQLPDALAEIRPHVFVAVPKVLEMAASRVRDTVASKGRIARGLGTRAMKWAMDSAGDLLEGRRPSGLSGLRFKLADRLLLSKIRARFGGRLKFMICGGAALSADVAQFFWAAGVEVYEGYGMTETSPVLTVNRRGAVRLGTVGLPIPGVEIRTAADGEVLARGPNVMRGYWNRPIETEQALVGGWIRTGDLGTVDAEGFLTLTGRKKEILVLSTGKNVAPRAVEESLEQSPYINRVIAVGDERPAVGVLIVPETERVLAWAAERDIATGDMQTLLASTEVRRLYENEIHRLQGKLATFEKARRFEFLLDEPSEENGLLTPTQKVRRHEVLRRYGQLVDRMYR
jgi:long-chain acyl-CoA synthetase